MKCHNWSEGSIRRIGLSLGISLLLLDGNLTFGAELRYSVINLQARATMEIRFSGARAINHQGDVAGTCFVPGDDQPKPFLYREGAGFRVLDELNGYGEAINHHAQVAVFGYVTNSKGGPTAWRWTPGLGYESLGTLGESGDIGDVPLGINNLGQVVGRSDTIRDGKPWQDAFLYTDGLGMVNLGSLGPDRYATATAINDLGQITGHSGGDVFLFTKETGMVPIGHGGGFAINTFGVVAGDVGDEAAIFFDGITQRLGTLGGQTTANDINDHNVVVGSLFYDTSYPSYFSSFIWTEWEGILDLGTLVEPGWFFGNASAINNNGQIAAEANGVAVRLDPIPPKLSIQQTPTNRVVSWSPAWPGLVLESTSSLTEPDWQPLDTGGTNVVSIPLETLQRYFRLNLDGARGLCCGP